MLIGKALSCISNKGARPEEKNKKTSERAPSASEQKKKKKRPARGRAEEPSAKRSPLPPKSTLPLARLREQRKKRDGLSTPRLRPEARGDNSLRPPMHQPLP